MGEAVYSCSGADSLADVANTRWFAQGIHAEAEIYAAAYNAWLQVSGESESAYYPARNESAVLTGEDWDFDDPQLMKQHLPRLAALFIE